MARFFIIALGVALSNPFLVRGPLMMTGGPRLLPVHMETMNLLNLYQCDVLNDYMVYRINMFTIRLELNAIREFQSVVSGFRK